MLFNKTFPNFQRVVSLPRELFQFVDWIDFLFILIYANETEHVTWDPPIEYDKSFLRRSFVHFHE